MFFCDANTGIEVRNGRVYGQRNYGEQWCDDGTRYRLPLTESRARDMVEGYLRFCDAPQRAAALTALTGRKVLVFEA